MFVQSSKLPRAHIRRLLAMATGLGGIMAATHMKWGGIYIYDGSTAQTGITTTPEVLENFAANVGNNDGIKPDYTDNSLEVLEDGDYAFLVQLAFSGSLNTGFEIHLNVDGVETPFGTHRKMGTGGDEGSCSIVGPIAGMSAGEKVKLYINVTPSGTGDVTIIDCQFFGFKLP